MTCLPESNAEAEKLAAFQISPTLTARFRPFHRNAHAGHAIRLGVGIGGGVLIVPGLILAIAMPLSYAIGTSLVVVSALGLTTATSYAASGLVDWGVAALLVVGGVGGTISGISLGRRLANHRRLLERGFAGAVICVGGYVIASSMSRERRPAGARANRKRRLQIGSEPAIAPPRLLERCSRTSERPV